jgi:hypothetical protein
MYSHNVSTSYVSTSLARVQPSTSGKSEPPPEQEIREVAATRTVKDRAWWILFGRTFSPPHFAGCGLGGVPPLLGSMDSYGIVSRSWTWSMFGKMSMP